MDTEDRFSRLGPLSGVLFVLLQLGGVAVGVAGGRSTAALGDPVSDITGAYADPAGAGVWIGAYLEILSLAAFAVFAAWLFRSIAGTAGRAGVVTAATYVGLSLVALVVGDVLEYRAGHGMSRDTTLALFDLQSGLFFTTWGIGAAFLVLAPVAGWLRRTALGIAALLLVAMAFPTGEASQFPNLLFLLWTATAGVVLARRPREATAPLVSASAQSAG
jgi:hypothetical protein